jgi:hypothetical protein
MKRTKLFYIALMALSLYCCEKAIEPDPDQEEVFHLQGTKWKLAGIYDFTNNTLQQLQPLDCDRCYVLMFETDTYAIGKIILNQLNVWLQPHVTIGAPTEIGEPADGHLFYEMAQKCRSYSVTQEELQFLYEENGLPYCLLYERKPVTFLRNSRWCILGLFDVAADSLYRIKVNSIGDYWLNFDTDSTATGKLVNNQTFSFNLNSRPFVHSEIEQPGTDDAVLVINALTAATSYHLDAVELKLFYNNDMNYVLCKVVP